MKKGIIALVILLLCAFVYQASATDYYAQADAEITTATLWDTNPAGGGTDLTWASLADGDVLYANNHAITIANDIGSSSVTATLTTAAGTGTAGGSFTFNINTSAAKTLYVNRVAGTTQCLTVTGEGAGADTLELTINGTSTGSATTTAGYGTRLDHTLGVVAMTGANTAGAASQAYGVSSASAGKFTITGNSTGGATAAGVNSTTSSVFTVTGDCIGASGTGAGTGCGCGSSTGYCIVTGNIINGARVVGATGAVRWTPTAPSSGVTGHYVKFDGGGTAISVGTNTDDATKALTTFYYIDPTDGGSDQGSATTTGGGAWAN